jgi:hypothetical protein
MANRRSIWLLGTAVAGLCFTVASGAEAQTGPGSPGQVTIYAQPPTMASSAQKPLTFAFFDSSDNLVFRFDVTSITAGMTAAQKASAIYADYTKAVAALVAAGKPAPNINFVDPSTKMLAPQTLSIYSGTMMMNGKDVPFFTSLRVTDPTGERIVPGANARGDLKWQSAMLLSPQPGNNSNAASGMDASSSQSIVQAGLATVDDMGMQTDLYLATVDPTPGEKTDAILQMLATDLSLDGLDAQFDSTTDQLDLIHIPADEFFVTTNTIPG